MAFCCSNLCTWSVCTLVFVAHFLLVSAADMDVFDSFGLKKLHKYLIKSSEHPG